MRVLSSVILNTVINEGNFLRISDGHFNNNNKFKKFEIYDELKLTKLMILNTSLNLIKLLGLILILYHLIKILYNPIKN